MSALGASSASAAPCAPHTSARARSAAQPAVAGAVHRSRAARASHAVRLCHGACGVGDASALPTAVRGCRRRAAGARRVACAAASVPAGTPAPNGFVSAVVAGAKARMAVDPNFLFKLGVEVGMDEVITASVNVAARGNPLTWSPDVALQVLCHLFVACFNDIALVWYLAPVAGKAEETDPARAMAHVFQPGPFTALQRAAVWARKWRLYSVIGLATGFLSMLLTGALSRDAALLAPSTLARAAVTGALHLGVSANTRYQIVNGIEVLLYAALPQAVARVASVALRFGNNCAGSMSWLILSGYLAKVWPM